jgi:hypothetical protein
MAWVLTMGAFVGVAWSPRRRLERAVAALGGAAVALAVCLALVGAHAASWAGAAAALLPTGMLLGALAPLRREARIVGAAALVAVPFAAIVGVPGAWVLLLASAAASAIVAAVLAR